MMLALAEFSTPGQALSRVCARYIRSCARVNAFFAFPEFYSKRRDILRQATVLAAAGRVQREQGACSVLVFEVWAVAGE